MSETKCSTCGGARDENPACSNAFHVTPPAVPGDAPCEAIESVEVSGTRSVSLAGEAVALTTHGALMSAIEEAVKSCATQHGKGIPSSEWQIDYAGIASRLAPVRASEPTRRIDYGHLPECNANHAEPIGPMRSCLCFNLMQDGIKYRASARSAPAGGTEGVQSLLRDLLDNYELGDEVDARLSAALSHPRAEVTKGWPGPLDGVWPEELRAAMNVIEDAVSVHSDSPLAEQGRITDAFTALKAYIRKARRALAASTGGGDE